MCPATQKFTKYTTPKMLLIVSQELEDKMKDSINKDYKCKNVVDCFSGIGRYIERLY